MSHVPHDDTPRPAKDHAVREIRKPRALGVLLCYNDADILAEQIEYLLGQHHDVIAWDHGSSDGTADVLDRYADTLLQRRYLPRSFDFYDLYPAMSANLIENFIGDYDMISWPDQDEFLEGPARDKSYYAYLTDVYNSPYTYIQFRNFVFWYGKDDDPRATTVRERIRRYSLWKGGQPRIRAWKAAVTNRRVFNHNVLEGRRYPELFNLRHYPMRSEAHLKRRLFKDRADLRREGENTHYETIRSRLDAVLAFDAGRLHVDDGISELRRDEVFDWSGIYLP